MDDHQILYLNYTYNIMVIKLCGWTNRDNILIYTAMANAFIEKLELWNIHEIDNISSNIYEQ
jgi:hypothetical protein